MGDEDKPYKEKVENIYKDDLFAPPTGWKVYQIISVCLSEYFGSFFLMLVGCSSYLTILPIVGVVIDPYPSVFEVALGWGFSYGALYVCMAHISGLFLNPILTLVMVIIGEMSIYRMLLYIVFEIAGSLTGVALIKATGGTSVRKSFCLAKPTKGLPLLNAFVYEMWGSFILSMLFCICHDSRTRNSFDFSPVKFAFSFFALHIALDKFTGCSLNPARSLSASIIAVDFGTLWLYIAAPFTGAILAAVIYLLLFNASITEPGGEPAPEAAAA